jgi:hypothetical protein
MDKILPHLISDEQVVERFRGASLRTVRARARQLGIGRRFSRTYYFTEEEIIALMKGFSKCLAFSNGGARRSGTSEGRSPGELSTRLQKQKTKALLDGLRTRSKSNLQDQPAKNVTPLRSKMQPAST